MPIERKDRSFDKIFDEVTLDRIPMDYIKSIRVKFHDGTYTDLSKVELENMTSEHDILRRFETDVLDVAITLDYNLIKKDVKSDVKNVLGTLFKDSDSEVD